jgi:predicted hydrocarbon binding protein
MERAMADLADEAATEGVMKAAGRPCANQILAECTEILGRRPETVDELLDATNRRRREQLGLEHQWVRDRSSAYLRLEDCNCTLVKAGLARPNPTHCMCSAGMFEELFSSVCRGSVSVKVLKAIGFGDTSCAFLVDFQE